MRRAVVFALTLALSHQVGEGTAWAATPAGAAFLNVPVSVRQIGMGGVSTGGFDLLRAWSNPAVLAEQRTRGQAALTGASVFGGEFTTIGSGASWLLTPSWSVGAMYSGFTANYDEVDEYGETKGGRYRSVSSIGAASAWRVGPARAGVMLKMVNDSVFDQTASALAADVGVTVSVAGATAGVAYRNLGPSLRTAGAPGTYEESLPAELRAGVAYELAAARVSAGAEFAAAVGEPSRIAVGVEWRPVARFAVRAGTANLSDAGGQLTLGLSAELRSFALDYAAAAHPVGLTHKVSVGYAFGRTREDFAAAHEAARADRQAREAAAAAAAAEAAAALPPAADAAVGVSADAETPRPAKPAAMPTGRNLAVADLQAQGVSPTDAAVISDMLRSAIIKTGKYNVVEKANMERILAEQAFQQTGCTTSECAVKLGKLLNVHLMVVGSVGKMLGDFYLSVRLINVETGQSTYGDTARAGDSAGVEKAITRFAKEIAARVK